jgi:hypothetical protein
VPSYEQCILKLSQQDILDNELADVIRKSEVPDQTVQELAGQLSRAKREAAMQAVVMKKARNNMLKYTKGSPFDRLAALLTKDNKHGAPYANVEYQAKAYMGRFHSKMAAMLERFAPKGLGFLQDHKNLEKLAQAVYGKTTDDAQINGFAKTWLDMVEEIRQLKNKFGASISKNERFLLPQAHDMRAVNKAGFDTWREKIYNKLDRSMMLDDQGNQLTDGQVEDLLAYVYESITTGGLNKVKDLTVPRLGKKLARKGSERRVLYFKDAESWIEYQKDFGQGDLFTVMTDYIEQSANDIALLEILGPNPNTTFEALFAMAKKEGFDFGQERQVRSIFNVVSGKVNQGELTTFADGLTTYRNIETAALLGKAFLSSFSDIGFQLITAKYNGVPAFKTLSRHLGTFVKNDPADMRAAARIGLIADTWVQTANSGNRYADIYGVGRSSKVANAVMKASLLEPWTNSGRKAFGMEFSGALADNFSKTFDELDDALKAAFQRNDILPEDWDVLRKTELFEHKGATFADFTLDETGKFHRMVLMETDLAVPTPDARVRAVTTGGLSRNTAEGALWRSAFMVKSFPITIGLTHFYRAAYQATTIGKLQYAASLLATTSVLGGIALLAKDIAAGRDPRPVDNPKFFASAIQQGGGLGIFGDFVFSDVNRFGGGITETIIGPTGDTVDTAVRFTLGNLREAVQGEETNILGEAGKIVERYTPNIWQIALFKQALFDQYEMMADPDAQLKFRRMIRKRESEYNQEYWWRPGEFTPRRAPEFDNVIEAD